MYLKVGTVLLTTSLEGIAGNIQKASTDVGATIVTLLKAIFDGLIIPLAIIGVLARIFFVVMSVVKSKRKREGEGLEEHILELLIDIVVLLLIAGYGAFAWGILG